MKHTKNLFFILSIIIIASVLSACSYSTTKVGCVCMNSSNELDCQYELFDGGEIKSIAMDAGEVLQVHYEVEVESGRLSLILQDAAGVVLLESEMLDTSEDDLVYKATKDGCYRLIIEGLDTKGSYLVNWSLE